MVLENYFYHGYEKEYIKCWNSIFTSFYHSHFYGWDGRVGFVDFPQINLLKSRKFFNDFVSVKAEHVLNKYIILSHLKIKIAEQEKLVNIKNIVYHRYSLYEFGIYSCVITYIATCPPIIPLFSVLEVLEYF